MVFGLGQSEVFIHGKDLRRRGVVRTETVAATDDKRGIFFSVESLFHVEVEGLTVGTGFFGAVEDGDAFYAGRDSGHEVFGRERAIEVHGNQTHFLAFGSEVVDGLANGFGNRTHGDDDVLGIGGSVVVEQAVFATGDFRDFVHVLFYDGGNCVVEVVARFTVSKEGIGVLGHTACHGVLGVERTVAELFQGFLVDERSKVFVFEHLDFLYLVRGTEAVEEVDKRHTRFDGGEVGNTGQVHHFLYRTFGEHGETGLAGRHHVLVVTENTEGVRCQCTSRHMEYTGKEFSGNLVHIGNHQQQTLRSGVGGCQSTGLQRSVYGTGSSGL